MTPIAQQALAVETCARILSGAVTPTRKDKEFLLARVKDAANSLRWLERHEDKIRRRVESA